MKIKSIALDPKRVKAGPEDGLAEGEFIVYPSTFTRQADAYGDVVAKGAFADTIAEWKDSGNTLPGLYGHRMDDPDYFVAEAIDQGEDDHGWWIKGRFDMDSPKGPQVYRLVKGKRISQLSFAFDVIESGKAEGEDGEAVNELRKLKVYEFSFVPVGANQDTSVVAVKALADAAVADVKAGRVLAAKHIDSLRSAQEAIGAVIEAASVGDDQEKASDADEVKSGTSDEEHQIGTVTVPVYAKLPAPDEEPKSGQSSVERLAAQAHIYALQGAGRGSR